MGLLAYTSEKAHDPIFFPLCVFVVWYWGCVPGVYFALFLDSENVFIPSYTSAA